MFVALGLEFDLESSPHQYRSDPAWCQKFLSSQSLSKTIENCASAREFYKVFGCVIRFLYSTERKLRYFRSSLAFLRRSASDLASAPEK